MLPETRQWLADARRAAEEVIELATEAWAEDRVRALAIERLLMSLGEALLRIRTNDSSVLDEITDGHRIIGMRNVLVHGYDLLDPSRIAEAIRSNLPVLIREIDEILAGSGR